MTDFSFQLYSARNFPPIESVLAMVARLGYRQVEAYAGLFADPAGLAKMVADNGLAMPTAHIGLDLLQQTQKTIDIAGTLGIGTVICPAIPNEQRAQGAQAWERLAETLAGLGEAYRRAGLGFGWHNHDFEFVPTADGRLPMDILLGGAPDMLWEVDVAWLVKGGQRPDPWFDRFGSRIVALHVKDLAAPGEAVNEDGWADVGYGTLDWPAIYAAARARTQARYFVMEHDNPADVERFARRSIATAQSWG